MAAIISNGKSTINRIYHLDRGYENFELKLKKLGIEIVRDFNERNITEKGYKIGLNTEDLSKFKAA